MPATRSRDTLTVIRRRQSLRTALYLIASQISLIVLILSFTHEGDLPGEVLLSGVFIWCFWRVVSVLGEGLGQRLYILPGQRVKFYWPEGHPAAYMQLEAMYRDEEGTIIVLRDEVAFLKRAQSATGSNEKIPTDPNETHLPEEPSEPADREDHQGLDH